MNGISTNQILLGTGILSSSGNFLLYNGNVIGTQTTQGILAINYATGITPNCNYNINNIATLTGNLFLFPPVGTRSDGQLLSFRISYDSTGRSLTTDTGISGFKYGTDIVSGMFPSTSGSNYEFGIRWNEADSKWRVVALVRGF